MDRLMAIKVLGAACALVAVLGACVEERNCTAIGCGPSRYELRRTAWPAGDYTLELSYEAGADVDVVCSFEVETAPAATDDDAGVEEEHAIDCTASAAGRIDAHHHQQLFLEMNDSPRELQLTLRHDGAVIHDATLEPSYTVTEINGPGCGECRVADETIDVDAR